MQNIEFLCWYPFRNHMHRTINLLRILLRQDALRTSVRGKQSDMGRIN